jgi:hypothetical protein
MTRGQATPIRSLDDQSKLQSSNNPSDRLSRITPDPHPVSSRLGNQQDSNRSGLNRNHMTWLHLEASRQYLLFTMYQNRRETEASRNLVFLQRMTHFRPLRAPGACCANACRANVVSACAERLGGAYRDRTDDPLLAKQVLSQLS